MAPVTFSGDWLKFYEDIHVVIKLVIVNMKEKKHVTIENADTVAKFDQCLEIMNRTDIIKQAHKPIMDKLNMISCYIDEKVKEMDFDNIVKSIADVQQLPLYYYRLIKTMSHLTNIKNRLKELYFLLRLLILHLKDDIPVQDTPMHYTTMNYEDNMVSIIKYELLIDVQRPFGLSKEFYDRKEMLESSKLSNAKSVRLDLNYDFILPTDPENNVNSPLVFLISNEQLPCIDFIPVLDRMRTEFIKLQANFPVIYPKVEYLMHFVSHLMMAGVSETNNGVQDARPYINLMERCEKLLELIPTYPLLLDKRIGMTVSFHDLIYSLESLFVNIFFRGKNFIPYSKLIGSFKSCFNNRHKMEVKASVTTSVLKFWNDPNPPSDVENEVIVRDGQHYTMKGGLLYKVKDFKLIPKEGLTIYDTWKERFQNNPNLEEELSSREESNCVMCLEKYPNNTDTLAVLSGCTHVSCVSCLEQWITSRLGSLEVNEFKR